MIRLTTNQGTIELELDSEKAPITAKNFERYVTEGFYDGTIFHRVIKGFINNLCRQRRQYPRCIKCRPFQVPCRPVYRQRAR